LVKDVESIVVRDLPWNVLFYRKNLNAYRNDAWVGWVNTPPQLYNYWSLVNLAPAGLVTPPIPPTTGVFSVAMTVPGRVRFGATATKRVTITVGPPAPIATLNLSTSKPVIRPTDTTQITATLIDGTGAPMAGVNVSIDKKVLLGTIAPEYGLTSASGKIVFTYT